MFKPYHVSEIKTISIDLNKYHRFASRETCLARDELWVTWLIDNGCKSMLDIPNGKVYDYYVEEESFLKALDKLKDRMISNWSKHINNYEKSKKDLIEKAKKVSENIGKNELLDVYLEWLNEAHRYGEYIFGAWAVIYHLEKELMQKYQKDIDLILSLDQPIEYMKMQLDITRLPLQELIEKYGWLNVYNPYDAPYSESELIKIKNELKDVNKELAKFERVKKEFEAFVNNIKDEVLKNKFLAIHTYVYLKTDRVDAWKKAMWHLNGFYRYIASSAGTTIKEAANLSAEETIDFIKGCRLPSNLKLRNNALYFFTRNKIEILTDKALTMDILSKLEKRNYSEIKGIVASKGYAKGRVCVISNSNDVKKVCNGDIFVAKYTYPSFTPYMAKCAAIITDEGGLTSHAAVVARELGLPCIVGAMVATKALKDGDMVEVDADKCIVRILPKNK